MFLKWQFKPFAEPDNGGVGQFRKGNSQPALGFSFYFQVSVLVLDKLLCSRNRWEGKLISVSFLIREKFQPCLLSNLSRLRDDHHSLVTKPVTYFIIIGVMLVGLNFHAQGSLANMLG